MLRSHDPLPRRPQRIVIAGVSGAGKTTLAERVSRLLGIPHTEIDSLHWGPEWTPRDTFVDDVHSLAERDAWVIEWQYSSVRALLAARADLMIWLDLPFMTVTLPRVIRRTVTRRIRREELWNGNTEGPFRTFFTDPEHIVRWAWSTRHAYQEPVPRADSEYENLTVVRLRSKRDVERWMLQILAPLATQPESSW